MELTEIENELNALIIHANVRGGCVWIVDKKGNNFALRVREPVKLKAFIPREEETEETE